MNFYDAASALLSHPSEGYIFFLSINLEFLILFRDVYICFSCLVENCNIIFLLFGLFQLLTAI